MELFQITNGVAMPSIHALIIEPYKTIWEEDETEKKGEAIKIFTYIELLCNPMKSNPFSGYSDKDRPSKVKEEVWKDANYQHPKFQQIIQGVLIYKRFLVEAAPSYNLYTSSMSAADDLTDFFNSVDLTERTRGGTAVYKPKDITSALKDVPETIKALLLLRDKVHSELIDSAKTRNQRLIGYFER